MKKKTALLQKLAAETDVDVVVWIGCAMRGDRLAALSETVDASRTVQITNTAEMPPAVGRIQSAGISRYSERASLARFMEGSG